MLPWQLEALKARARETLNSGGSIAVLGWTERHNESTKGLVTTKKVTFYSARQSKRADYLTANVGLALFTKFVAHDVTKGLLKRKRNIHPTVLEVREIREILTSCADILLLTPKPAARDGPEAPRVISLEDEVERLELVVLDFLIRTRRTTVTTNDGDFGGFAVAFLELASKSDDGAVGKMVTTRLRKKHGIRQEPRRLAMKDWLVSVVLDGGTKVSRYKPGEKMLALAAAPEPPEPPENKYELALWFAEQGPALRAKREAIEGEMKARLAELEAERDARLAEVDADIADVDRAKGALEQLNLLKRPSKKVGGR